MPFLKLLEKRNSEQGDTKGIKICHFRKETASTN